MTKAVIDVTPLPDGRIMFTVGGAGFAVLDTNRVHEANRAYAEFHGWKARCIDTAAMNRDTDTGLPASPAEKLDAIKRLVAHYESGTADWKMVSAGKLRGGLLYEALCRLHDGSREGFTARTADEIRAYIDNLSDREESAVREDVDVAPIITAIKAERQAAMPPKARVDTKTLLAGLR